MLDFQLPLRSLSAEQNIRFCRLPLNLPLDDIIVREILGDDFVG